MRSNKLLIITLALMFNIDLLCHPVYTNPNNSFIFEGVILDNFTNEPINDAYIRIGGYSNYSTTDHNGNFKIILRNENVVSKIFFLVTHPGYLNYCDSLEIKSSKSYKQLKLKANFVLPTVHGFVDLNITGFLTTFEKNSLDRVKIIINDNNFTSYSNYDGSYNFQPTNVNPEIINFLWFIKDGFIPIYKKIKINRIPLTDTYYIGIDTSLIQSKRDTLMLDIVFSGKHTDEDIQIIISDLIKVQEFTPNQYKITFHEPLRNSNVKIDINSEIYDNFYSHLNLDERLNYSEEYSLHPKIHEIEFRFIDKNFYDVANSYIFLKNDSLGRTDNNGNLITKLGCYPDSSYCFSIHSNLYDTSKTCFTFEKNIRKYRINTNQSRNINLDFNFIDILSSDSSIYKPELAFVKVDTHSVLSPFSSIIVKETSEKQVNIHFEHPYYLSFDTTFSFDERHYYKLTKTVIPNKHKFKAFICDSLSNPIKNTKVIYNNKLLSISDCDGFIA